MAEGGLDVPRDGASHGVTHGRGDGPSHGTTHGWTDDAGPAEAQSAGPASGCILHHCAVLGAVTAQVAFHEGYLDRYLRIFARTPHTAIEHQRPLPAGLRS